MRYLLIIILLLCSCSYAPRQAINPVKFRQDLRESLEQNRKQFEKEYDTEIKQLKTGIAAPKVEVG